jgi:hypothetical protein
MVFNGLVTSRWAAKVSPHSADAVRFAPTVQAKFSQFPSGFAAGRRIDDRSGGFDDRPPPVGKALGRWRMTVRASSEESNSACMEIRRRCLGDIALRTM